MSEHEELLSRLLFEAGERIHATHVTHDEHFTTIITYTTSSLCQRIMAALISQVESQP